MRVGSRHCRLKLKHFLPFRTSAHCDVSDDLFHQVLGKIFLVDFFSAKYFLPKYFSDEYFRTSVNCDASTLFSLVPIFKSKIFFSKIFPDMHSFSPTSHFDDVALLCAGLGEHTWSSGRMFGQSGLGHFWHGHRHSVDQFRLNDFVYLLLHDYRLSTVLMLRLCICRMHYL